MASLGRRRSWIGCDRGGERGGWVVGHEGWDMGMRRGGMGTGRDEGACW